MIPEITDMEKKEARICEEKSWGNFGFRPEPAKYDLPNIGYRARLPVVIQGSEPDSIYVRFSPDAVAAREAEYLSLESKNVKRFFD